MKQMSFVDAEFAGKRTRTGREIFLEEMEQVVPRKSPLALIEAHYPVAGGGRRPYPLEAMLRAHLMQSWFGLSDRAMEEALHQIAPMRMFAGQSVSGAIPDETTSLKFRRLLEKRDVGEMLLARGNAHLSRKGLQLERGTIMDSTIAPAPSSTRIKSGERASEMHQTNKGEQWLFGMKAHIGVDVDSGLRHTVKTTAANEADIEQAEELLHGKEQLAFGDAGYTGAEKRCRRRGLRWEFAKRIGRIAAIKNRRERRKVEREKQRKGSVRARVGHRFRVIKRQFGLVKVRFRGLAKNTAPLRTPFALSNLRMARSKLLALAG